MCVLIELIKIIFVDSDKWNKKLSQARRSYSNLKKENK